MEAGGDKSRQLIKLLGFPKNLGEYINPSMKFCNLNKLEFEPDSKLPARQKMWAWMVKCLQGPKSVPGPYFYLTQQCLPYDISFLFKKLLSILETVTICSLDDEVYNVTHMDFNPGTQDLFAYLEDLRRAVRRLEDLNERLPEDGRVILSETYIRSRLVRAARQVPMYKAVIDGMIALPVNEWSTITVNQLISKLEAATANDLSMVPKRSTVSTADDTVSANYANSANTVNPANKPKQSQKETRTCYGYAKNGSCNRPACPFVHQKNDVEKSEVKSFKSGPTQTAIFAFYSALFTSKV